MCTLDYDENQTIRTAGITRESVVDGPGIRFVVWGQGCPHNCVGCHNPHTHEFNGGTETPIAKILAEIDRNPLLRGVTFSGGEPFCQAAGFAVLAEAVHQRNLDIVAYTGYTYEELVIISSKDEETGILLRNVDILIDGLFEMDKKDLSLQFRGSDNQRILDMTATRQAGHAVMWMPYT